MIFTKLGISNRKSKMFPRVLLLLSIIHLQSLKPKIGAAQSNWMTELTCRHLESIPLNSRKLTVDGRKISALAFNQILSRNQVRTLSLWKTNLHPEDIDALIYEMSHLRVLLLKAESLKGFRFHEKRNPQLFHIELMAREFDANFFESFSNLPNLKKVNLIDYGANPVGISSFRVGHRFEKIVLRTYDWNKREFRPFVKKQGVLDFPFEVQLLTSKCPFGGVYDKDDMRRFGLKPDPISTLFYDKNEWPDDVPQEDYNVRSSADFFTLKDVAQITSSQKSITISDKGITCLATQELATKTSLESLCLKNTELNPEDVNFLIENLSELTRVTIHNYSFLNVLLHKTPNLQHVEVRSPEYDRNFFQSLSELLNLRELHIVDDGKNPEGIGGFNPSAKFERLRFSVSNQRHEELRQYVKEHLKLDRFPITFDRI